MIHWLSETFYRHIRNVELALGLGVLAPNCRLRCRHIREIWASYPLAFARNSDPFRANRCSCWIHDCVGRRQRYCWFFRVSMQLPCGALIVGAVCQRTSKKDDRRDR